MSTGLVGDERSDDLFAPVIDATEPLAR